MIDRMSPAAAQPGASTAVTTVVRLRVEAQSLAHDGGGAMVPFPRMACP